MTRYKPQTRMLPAGPDAAATVEIPDEAIAVELNVSGQGRNRYATVSWLEPVGETVEALEWMEEEP